ncbi:MAG: tRNA glutamyl-Q(34) synthetase GluQRS [Gammaproteobacteria bacterium]|nr:tRNA glutamyl-Q(34) synthetase GluQRS [Gammaproteobacteria bacterium]
MPETGSPPGTDDTPAPCGRFAPSPTGPLHFGSLVSAVASLLQARRRGGRWLVRIEDLDPPREVPGAADAILAALDHHGLAWDGPVLYQSTREDAYLDALERLAAAGLTYRCTCSRKVIARVAAAGIAGPIYPGTCRRKPPPAGRRSAIRLRVPAGIVAVSDGHFGRLELDVAGEIGDFVLRRADGLFAYQLAVVIDDADQAVSEVVRGSDLLDLTPAQICLQRLLGFAVPAYLHHPVVTGPDGNKLSKQTGARGLDDGDPRPNLVAALAFLGQDPPEALRAASLDELWRWAIARWDPRRMPGRRDAPAPPRYEM